MRRSGEQSYKLVWIIGFIENREVYVARESEIMGDGYQNMTYISRQPEINLNEVGLDFIEKKN